MSKSAGQKLRLLHLERLLLERSDEDNPLTVRQIMEALETIGIMVERKTVYDDVESLLQIGMDIITVRGKSNSYYVGERAFQLPELKLLIDMVQSARFVTTSKSASLITKLTMLTSRAQARQLARQVHMAGRIKVSNESIYYNVDAIHTALNSGRQISFRFFELAVTETAPRFFGKRLRQDGHIYRLSPWALNWDNENYYLIGYDSEEDKVKHYRVDNMEGIRVLAEARVGSELFKRFNSERYTRMAFGMFTGAPTNVRLRFANRLIEAVIDRLGDTISIHPCGDGHFIVNAEVALGSAFMSWLLCFGQEAELLSPLPLRERLRQELVHLAELYQDPKRESEVKPCVHAAGVSKRILNT